jgi:hypothetical protein
MDLWKLRVLWLVFIGILAIDALIYFGYFLEPAPPLEMVEIHQVGIRPVKVIGDVGYLLEQLGRGVAYGSPELWTST